jgi:hypothetical protein
VAETPRVLLEHYLKQLRLPTVLREFPKLSEQCAKEGATCSNPQDWARCLTMVQITSCRFRHPKPDQPCPLRGKPDRLRSRLHASIGLLRLSPNPAPARFGCVRLCPTYPARASGHLADRGYIPVDDSNQVVRKPASNFRCRQKMR